jgi:hypothetical protein
MRHQPAALERNSLPRPFNVNGKGTLIRSMGMRLSWTASMRAASSTSWRAAVSGLAKGRSREP